jgi:hypothetical protein
MGKALFHSFGQDFLPHQARHSRHIDHVAQQGVIRVRIMVVIVSRLGPKEKQGVIVCMHQSASFLLNPH